MFYVPLKLHDLTLPSRFCRRRIEKLERVSLALIRLAYTSVPEGKREASTFRLERSHPVAAIADMEDIPVLTASIRCPLKIETAC